MNSKPLISIILPVYNTEAYVREAIESVLAQTYSPIELICVNDGSTDGSLAILESFGDNIRIVNNEKNLGIAGARNAGIKIAHGAFLAFMDADDIWEKEKLESQMREFEANPELGIMFCHMSAFVSPELPEEIKKTRYVPSGSMPGYISASALIKREIFEKVGAFNPKWRIGEFIDWFARAKALGIPFGIVPGVFHKRRIHATNTGVSERSSHGDYLRIVHEALKRKRNGPNEHE